jgi:hypothetical protein
MQTWACTNFQENLLSSSHHERHQPITVSNPSNIYTATKRAVATNVDPTGADDTSPVQQPLFASNTAAAAPQDLFEDLASDEESLEQLSRRFHPRPPPPHYSRSLPPSQFFLNVDDGETESNTNTRERPHSSVPGVDNIRFVLRSHPADGTRCQNSTNSYTSDEILCYSRGCTGKSGKTLFFPKSHFSC